MCRQTNVKAAFEEVPSYNAIFKQTVVGIACVALDGHFLEVNAKFCETTGYDREQLLQLNLQDLVYLNNLEDWIGGNKQTSSTTININACQANIKASMNTALFCDGVIVETTCRCQGKVIAVEIAILYQDLTRGLFVVYLRDLGQLQTDRSLLALRRRLSTLTLHSPLKVLMQNALDCAEDLTSSHIGFFHLINPDQRTVALQTWSNNTLKDFCPSKYDELLQPVSKAGVWSDCVYQRHPVIHNDCVSQQQKIALPDGYPQLTRVLVVPIMRDEIVVAAFGVGNKEALYTEYDTQLVQEIGDLAFDYVERRQVEDRIQFMACYDVLTRLPNRVLLFDLINKSITLANNSNSTFALAYMDLDGFKPVNDHYGHDIGDQLLVACAQRIAEPLHKHDTLARLGGDEFALILNGLDHHYDGEVMLRKILETLDRPFQVANQEIWLSASFGFTIYPLDQASAETLLRHADQAMYQAKRRGKNTICLYDATRGKRQHFYQQALKELCHATLAKDELLFYYQPRINVINGDVTGVEALVRWRHPRRGLLRPNEFIPGLGSGPEALRLDKWAISQALAQIAAWESIGESLFVSVNVHHKNLCQRAFLDFVRIQAAQWPKAVVSHLEIEVQDPATVTDVETLARSLAVCVELGIRFILDDFGSCCSSMKRFWHLPIHAITLDNKLVRGITDNIENLKIVEDVTCVAHDFQLPVIAKGVETLELAALMIDVGCPLVQGYSIAQPMPADLVLDWYRNWPRDPRRQELLSLGQSAPTDALLRIVIYGVTRWSNCVTNFAETRGISERPLLCDDQCSVTHWYNGLGRLCYGDRPDFPFLDNHHRTLHLMAAKLVGLVESGYPHQDCLTELYVLRDEFIAMLKRLSNNKDS